MQLAQISTAFYLEKQQWMLNQLTGYWAEDEWIPKNSPLLKGELKYQITRLHFDKINSWALRIEIKYACDLLATEGKWSFKKLHASSTFITRISEWLNQLEFNINSLIEREPEFLLTLLRSYLTNNRVYRPRATKPVVNSSGVLCGYSKDDECIYVFKRIYKTIQEVYDDREEYEKDIWDVRKLGYKILSSRRGHYLDFTHIHQTWLRIAAKKFIKYQLNQCTWNTCYIKLRAIKIFADFLENQYPFIKPSELNRPVVLAYISYVSTLLAANNTRFKYVTDLRQFLGLCARESWLDISKQEIIYDDDLPKWQKLKQPRYIPQEVIDQLNQHLSALPLYMQRMLLILQECGMRISELCTISFDCLLQDGTGNSFLRYYQHKMKKEHSIPISKEVAKIIRTQQQDVIQEWGQCCPYLFPTPKPRGKGQAISYNTILHAINKLAYDKNICNSTGELWRFKLHQFRHTVGTSMINKGVPQHIIQRYLGHESPQMTMVYAHIHSGDS